MRPHAILTSTARQQEIVMADATSRIACVTCERSGKRRCRNRSCRQFRLRLVHALAVADLNATADPTLRDEKRVARRVARTHVGGLGKPGQENLPRLSCSIKTGRSRTASRRCDGDGDIDICSKPGCPKLERQRGRCTSISSKTWKNRLASKKSDGAERNHPRSAQQR